MVDLVVKIRGEGRSEKRNDFRSQAIVRLLLLGLRSLPVGKRGIWRGEDGREVGVVW